MLQAVLEPTSCKKYTQTKEHELMKNNIPSFITAEHNSWRALVKLRLKLYTDEMWRAQTVASFCVSATLVIPTNLIFPIIKN